MQFIPLQPVASQTVAVQLGTQNARINVYAKTAQFDAQYLVPTTVLFCDVLVSDVAIISGVPCWQANRIVRDTYLGFSGDLAFYDMQGAGADPEYTGLGGRWQLVWLAPADLATMGVTG